jgi:hypothetical protein
LRLKPFFELASAADDNDDGKNDLLGLSLGEKADQFVKKARENPQWAYDILIKYVNHGKHRVNIKRSCCRHSANLLQYYQVIL